MFDVATRRRGTLLIMHCLQLRSEVVAFLLYQCPRVNLPNVVNRTTLDYI